MPTGEELRAAEFVPTDRGLERILNIPSVRALMALAGVSRGTAAGALAALRQQPTPLHLVTPTEKPSPKEHQQP